MALDARGAKRAREQADSTEESPGDDDDADSDSSDVVRRLLPKKPHTEGVTFSLPDLEAEVSSLREDPPSYVSRIGRLETPTLVCFTNGEIGPPKSQGPWILSVCIAGEEGDEAYGWPFRVSLTFSETMWPMKLAVVRFRGVFHHALAEEGGGMLAPFYRALPRDSRGACTVRLVLEHVRTFLVRPLASWKLSMVKFSGALTEEVILDSVAANAKINKERLDIIKKYKEKALHPELFASPPAWREEWFEPAFWQAVQKPSPDAWRSILTEHLTGKVFSFKVFTQAFCEKLVAEIFNFYASGLPARRPNSMNAYGIILNEIGLEPLIDELQKLLQPIGELLWPGPGSCWDGHHCFIVRYRAGEDLGLDMHTDDSDVTFNICLGLEFTGAGLQFCGRMGAPDHRKHSHTYQHVRGSCVVHLGRQRHGADDISSGERLNLILWNHSSVYRQSNEYKRPGYSAEASAPDKECVSYTHDRDYGNFKAYPIGKENLQGRGWCPRRSFEYPGFKPDSEKECASCFDGSESP